MKRFCEYVKFKENDQFSDPMKLSEEGNKSGCLSKMMRMAWDRYEPEVKDFFQQLANKDPDIKDLLQKLDRNPSNNYGDRGQRNIGHADAIVPPEADNGSGAELD